LAVIRVQSLRSHAEETALPGGIGGMRHGILTSFSRIVVAVAVVGVVMEHAAVAAGLSTRFSMCNERQIEGEFLPFWTAGKPESNNDFQLFTVGAAGSGVGVKWWRLHP
jgi:hypothetical protein